MLVAAQNVALNNHFLKFDQMILEIEFQHAFLVLNS